MMRSKPIITFVLCALLPIFTYLAAPSLSGGNIKPDWIIEVALILFAAAMLTWFAAMLMAGRREQLRFAPGMVPI